MRVVVILALFSLAAASNLKQRMQTVVTNIVKDTAKKWGDDTVMQLSFKSDTEEFTVAAGNVKTPDGKTRPATTEDTFMYGSGTKPVVAATVLRLVDQGKIKIDDKASKYIDPWLQKQNGTTLENIFGNAISKATVLDLIRMSAGIPDFEGVGVGGTDEFDDDVLKAGKSNPFDAAHYSATHCPTSSRAPNCQTSAGPSLYCEPGDCSGYSSTSYQVAGMLLTSVLQPEASWDDMDQRGALGLSADRYPNMQFPNKGKISNTLTVPGKCTSQEWNYATIYDQDASMNGWTCGNVIANTKDYAQFWVDLLDEKATDPLVSDASRTEMGRITRMTQGTLPGASYGAGLQRLRAGGYHSHSSDLSSFLGHEGDTYGFLAQGGFVPGLKAGFQLVLNRDYASPTRTATTCLVQIAAEEILGQTVNLGCQYTSQQVVV